MRRVRALAAAVTAAVVVVGCGSEPEPQLSGDGVLVLELGGEQPSLRASLIALGREVEPPRFTPAPVPSVAADPESPPPAPEPAPETPPESAPSPPPPKWQSVTLGEGETLIHLARRHLGDGRRYTDLLKWNGWTEREARRLPRGQQVRILVDPGR
jgi:hypothetical protein